MRDEDINIALVSPSRNLYSETFIQAHKDGIKGNIFFYHEGEIPTKLDREQLINSRRSRIADIIRGYFHLNRFSLAEKALIKSFRKNKIQVVLAEYGPVGTRILEVCKELSLPMIVHFHGYDASRRETLRFNNFYHEVFQYASYVIAVSHKMYDDLLEMGCPKEKLRYNSYGPRDIFFQIHPSFSIPQFISIGRFVDKKAPYYVVLAFKKVLEKIPEARLVVAGEGELLNSCKNIAAYFGMQNQIIFPGVITVDDFVDYLAESRALVQHSIVADDGDMEGTPLSILEGSAAGLPIIATRHGGICDVVLHQKTGFLVNEHDVDEMARFMINLLEDKDMAKKLGDAGKEHIQRNFRLDRHLNLLNRLISTALE